MLQAARTGAVDVRNKRGMTRRRVTHLLIVLDPEPLLNVALRVTQTERLLDGLVGAPVLLPDDLVVGAQVQQARLTDRHVATQRLQSLHLLTRQHNRN